MKAKTLVILGIVAALISSFGGVIAYGLYASGKPAFALILGVISLILAALSVSLNLKAIETMKAKTLEILAALISSFSGVIAYGLYASGKPAFALIWGVLALIWAVILVTNFWMARREAAAKKLSRTP